MRLCAAALACAVSPGAGAWIYPEHRDIALLAVEGLDPARRAEFDALWALARGGDEPRLCAAGADAAQGLSPACIDWAALSALAGDHSCSSRELVDTATRSDWVLLVADVTAQLKVDLSGIPITAPAEAMQGDPNVIADARRRFADEASRARRQNILRTSDTLLQRADPGYATRAGANFAHFMLPRADTGLDPGAYGVFALQSGAALNAAGVYGWYHPAALQKAGKLADPGLSGSERRTLARAALFDEAFALHFLEDMHAAGHIAGSWGDVSQRKGTHDYYNQNGLEVFTWNGRDRTVVVMGDAHMRPEDGAFAAQAVRESLVQLLDAAAGRAVGYAMPHVAPAEDQADAFDVCQATVFPDHVAHLGVNLADYREPLRDVLLGTPVPGLGPGLGSLPRSRSEVGAFLGLAAAVDARYLNGGFAPNQHADGYMAGLDVGFRVGLGLEGALGDTGDGLVYVQAGLHVDDASSNDFTDEPLGAVQGNLTAAIPARSGLSARIRMPYYLVPGDLLLLSPMYLWNPEAYERLAVASSGGGLLRWQQAWSTPIGRVQFMLGREIGVTWYGLWDEHEIFVPTPSPVDPLVVATFRSTYYDFPIVEFRPYRSFSANQSSSLKLQLFAGYDDPYHVRVRSPPGAEAPGLDAMWIWGLRFSFDWRYYW